MKKSIKVSLVAACAFGLVGAASLVSAEGPDTISLAGPAGKKAPVAFNHKAHQGKTTCGECHHGKGADGKQVAYVAGQKIEKCATCHELGKPADNMHKNCKGCHEQKKAGPTKCAECHK